MYETYTDNLWVVTTYTTLVLYLIRPKLAIFLMSYGVAFYLAFWV